MPATTSISHPSQLPNYCSHTSTDVFMPYNATTHSSSGKVYAKKSYPSTLSHGQNTSASTAQFLRLKKKANFGGLSYSVQQQQHQPVSVSRRNERERNRVKMVNMGFATLRNHIPNGAKNKKMSKVETLRSAVEYISQLQSLLSQIEGSSYSNQINDHVNDKSMDNNCPTAQSMALQHFVRSAQHQQENYPHDSSVSPKSIKSSAGSDISYDSYEAVERQFAEDADLFDFTALLG